MYHILHIDRSREVNRLVSNTLFQTAELSWVQNLCEAKKAMSKGPIDLILLDVDLPDGNGIDFCLSIQKTHQSLPIIFLTNQRDISKVISGFSAGADDYITKPVHSLELRARIESRIRRASQNAKELNTYEWKEVKINKSRQEVTIHENRKEKKIDLTTLEFKIMILLAQSVGTLLTRDHILNQIWGENIHVSPRSVDTHMSKLRTKLGRNAHVIQSIYGSGYKFCPTVT